MLKGALIGCGFFAQNHLHAWRDIDDVEIVALCDRDPERLAATAKAFGIERTYRDAEKAPASYRLLRAGPLTVRLEEGNLRYVTFAGEEALRAVSYVIRDRDRGTYQPPIENLAIKEDDRRFRVTYEGACRSEAATLCFRAEIVGGADGHLSFTVEAMPDDPFETNRCGFNILHPLDVAGQAVTLEHTNGTVGGGMFSYFTELNRKRPPVDLIEFVTHATNPIVHAADDESVMETLTALPHITRSVRAIVGNEKAYQIGPSTIAMRQNPYGSRTMPNPDRERICMAADDPRQDGLFAAAWTIGYAAAAAPGRLELLVPSAFSGPRGVLDEKAYAVRPVFHAVRWLAQAAGEVALVSYSDDPAVATLASRGGDRHTLLVANLSEEPCRTGLDGVPADARVTIVDAAAPGGRPHHSGGSDLHLDSFAIAKIEF